MIVCFEGIDLSGKTTQIAILDRALLLRGRKTRRFAFPSRQTPIGKLLASVLKGECQVPTEALFELFSANRLEHLQDIAFAVGDGCVVLCDRYSPSEYAYGRARGLDFNWLSALESHMPLPDLVILLDIDYDTAIQRIKDREQLDVFERDRKFIVRVRNEYLRLAADKVGTPGQWLIVDASMSPNDVHNEILNALVDKI